MPRKPSAATWPGKLERNHDQQERVQVSVVAALWATSYAIPFTSVKAARVRPFHASDQQ